MLDEFYTKKIDLHAQSGYKLRKIRLRRHKSVKEIANACDVSEASIRFYENGSRQLTDDRIKDIASILNVDESALQDHRLNSIADIMHLFYDLEDAEMLIPVHIPEWDMYTVCIKNSLLSDAIKEWVLNYNSTVTEQVDSDSYDKWRELYPSESFQNIPFENTDLPFDFGNEPKDRITDYAYYAMVTVLRLRQILTRDKGEVRAFIEACGTPSVKAKYITTVCAALNIIDRELGRMVEQARITTPINDDSSFSQKTTDSQDTIEE